MTSPRLVERIRMGQTRTLLGCEAELGTLFSLAQRVEYQVKRRVGAATSLNAVWPVQERLRQSGCGRAEALG